MLPSMDLDPWKALAGAIVGFTVGLTGMGGGALMTPILVLVFGIDPGTAVSSDLLASLIMKPVGATVHFRRGTVNWSMARWLALGSVPAAFAGVFVLNELGSGDEVAKRIKTLLGLGADRCGRFDGRARVHRRAGQPARRPRRRIAGRPAVAVEARRNGAHRPRRRIRRRDDVRRIGVADDGDAVAPVSAALGEAARRHRPRAGHPARRVRPR